MTKRRIARSILSVFLSLILIINGFLPGILFVSTVHAESTTKTITPGSDDAKTGTGTMEISLTIKKTPAAGDFTFTPPTSPMYDGQPKAATVTTEAEGMGEVTVEYYNGDTKLDSAPTAEGTYIVRINVAESDDYKAATGITADSWTFTILPMQQTMTITLTIPGEINKGEVSFDPDSESNIKGMDEEKIQETQAQLKKIAEEDETSYNDDNQIKEVTVEMKAKPVEESDLSATDKTLIAAEIRNTIPDSLINGVKRDYLDLSVEKTITIYNVDGGQVTEPKIIELTDLGRVIDIPVKYDMTGKHNPVIVRCHDNKTQTFTRLTSPPDNPQDATFYIEGEGQDAVIHIYSSLFSTYALLTYGDEEYKEMAKIATAPKAKTLTANGTAQKLVSAGTTTGGTMLYALGTNDTTVPGESSFTESIPTGERSGTYYVWYMVKADSDHTDSNAFCVKVTISPKTVEPENPVETEKTVPMYRLFNKGTLEHLYTDSKRERNVLAGSGWIYEGIAWYAPEKSKTPVYRLYNPILNDHHYTIDAHERDVLSTKHGWIYEGIGWYSDDAKTVPIYRRFYPFITSGSHHYTNSLNEAKHLVKVGWIDEGIGWYGAAEK